MGLHVAVIMDGNGRWAQTRGMPREEGHRVGAERIREVVETAVDHGVRILTLYAFSSDNWNRPPGEVQALMELFGAYLADEAPRLAREGIRLRVVGRRDRLAPALLEAVRDAEAATAPGERMTLRLAVDYSSRDLMTTAARELAGTGDAEVDRDAFAAALGRVMHDGGPAAPVDLLIRTGGEKRLSDFLLWECAYAELIFSDRLWPDFGGGNLVEALHEFRSRDRRFGRVAAAG